MDVGLISLTGSTRQSNESVEEDRRRHRPVQRNGQCRVRRIEGYMQAGGRKLYLELNDDMRNDLFGISSIGAAGQEREGAKETSNSNQSHGEVLSCSL